MERQNKNMRRREKELYRNEGVLEELKERAAKYDKEPMRTEKKFNKFNQYRMKTEVPLESRQNYLKSINDIQKRIHETLYMNS